MAKEIVIDLTPGTVTHALWCPDCKLPSRFTVPLLWITENGVNTLGTVDRCTDCGRKGDGRG